MHALVAEGTEGTEGTEGIIGLVHFLFHRSTI